MKIVIDYYFGQELLLINPLLDLGSDQLPLDQYVLLMTPHDQDIYVEREKVFFPHETILLNGKEMLAGTVVLNWLNEECRDADMVEIVRDFFGWGPIEWSENQRLFIAEAENQGFTVDYYYLPKNSFGRICPSITIDYINSITISADFDVDEDDDIMFARY